MLSCVQYWGLEGPTAMNRKPAMRGDSPPPETRECISYGKDKVIF